MSPHPCIFPLNASDSHRVSEGGSAGISECTCPAEPELRFGRGDGVLGDGSRLPRGPTLMQKNAWFLAADALGRVHSLLPA